MFCIVFVFTVQASIPSNTYVISGTTVLKRIEELVPSIICQLGPESMDYLRTLQSELGGQRGGASDTIEEGDEEEDDEVPDLVENFEEAAAK